MEKQELLIKIRDNLKEINELQNQYDNIIETEKKKVLSQKTNGLKKSLYLWGFEFESSSVRTQQYLEFHRTFKKEFTELLKPYCSEIEISKPNHFDVSGFFKTNKGKIYYFSISDLRWDKKEVLIRTATDFNDYVGGSNNFISFEKLETEIKRYLK